jgi:hypothetical protein
MQDSEAAMLESAVWLPELPLPHPANEAISRTSRAKGRSKPFFIFRTSVI